jgi:hypothetical protein
VPKRIFGPKRVEVTGDQRKLHNEELLAQEDQWRALVNAVTNFLIS